jgi:hypothetical protein
LPPPEGIGKTGLGYAGCHAPKPVAAAFRARMDDFVSIKAHLSLGFCSGA